jgi:hypothetical protein
MVMNQEKLGRGFGWRWALACTVFLAASGSSPSSGRKPNYPEANLIKANTPAGYPYLAGGISVDEKKAMERASAAYNLRLFFARSAGVFRPQVLLLIASNDGSRIEQIAVRKPSFFIRLPTGSYTIMARFTRQIVIVKDIHLGEGGKKTYFLRGD